MSDLSEGSPDADRIVDQFHELYYAERERTWLNTFWLGTPVAKVPLDLWIYQEIIYATRPDVIVETGTLHGGSAFYFAHLCALIGTGRVVTIDPIVYPNRPEHPLIDYVRGSSTDPEIVGRVRSSIGEKEKVMVSLDSDHSCDHVLEELRTWAPVVTQGQYLIVEDTNLNGHPIVPDWGPGPMEALDAFLEETDEFVVDSQWEKFFFTWNPRGCLLRS